MTGTSSRHYGAIRQPRRARQRSQRRDGHRVGAARHRRRVIADLMKLVGADVAVFAWREASDPDGDGGPRRNPEEVLLRIAEQLAASPDVAGVFGRSLAVRVHTYIALSTARTST